MAKRIDALLSDYASYHQTKSNKICHGIGIPLIVYGILGMLQLLSSGSITPAEILIVVVTVYYLILEARLAVPMLLVVSLLDLAARAVARADITLVAFLVGWIFQAIGHARYERNRPAFFRNLVHLLVGPLFLLNELLHIRPIVIGAVEAQHSSS